MYPIQCSGLKPSCFGMLRDILLVRQHLARWLASHAASALSLSQSFFPEIHSYGEDGLSPHVLVPVRWTFLPIQWTRLLSAFGDRVFHLGAALREALRTRVIPGGQITSLTRLHVAWDSLGMSDVHSYWTTLLEHLAYEDLRRSLAHRQI